MDTPTALSILKETVERKEEGAIYLGAVFREALRMIIEEHYMLKGDLERANAALADANKDAVYVPSGREAMISQEERREAEAPPEPESGRCAADGYTLIQSVNRQGMTFKRCPSCGRVYLPSQTPA